MHQQDAVLAGSMGRRKIGGKPGNGFRYREGVGVENRRRSSRRQVYGVVGVIVQLHEVIVVNIPRIGHAATASGWKIAGVGASGSACAGAGDYAGEPKATARVSSEIIDDVGTRGSHAGFETHE